MPRIWRWTIGRAPEARPEGGRSSAAAEGGLASLARPGLSVPPEESSAADIQSGRAFFAGVAQRLNDAAGASTLGKDGGVRSTATFLSDAMDLSDRISRPVGSVGDFRVGRLPGESESFLGSLPSLMSYADPGAMARGDVVDSPFGTREDAGGPDLVDRTVQRSAAVEEPTTGPADVEVVPGESTFQRLNRLVEAGKARVAAERAAGGPSAARPGAPPPVPRSVPRTTPETRQSPPLARPVRRLADSISHEGTDRAPTPVPRSVPVARNEAGAAVPAPTTSAAPGGDSAPTPGTAPAPSTPPPGPAQGAPTETFVGRRAAPQAAVPQRPTATTAPAGPPQLPAAAGTEQGPAVLPLAAPAEPDLAPAAFAEPGEKPAPELPLAVQQSISHAVPADSPADSPADGPVGAPPGSASPPIARSTVSEPPAAASAPVVVSRQASETAATPTAPSAPTRPEAASTTGSRLAPPGQQAPAPAGEPAPRNIADRAPETSGVISRLADPGPPTAPGLPLGGSTSPVELNEQGTAREQSTGAAARPTAAPSQAGPDDVAGLPLAQRTPSAGPGGTPAEERGGSLDAPVGELSRTGPDPSRPAAAGDLPPLPAGSPAGPGLVQAKADPAAAPPPSAAPRSPDTPGAGSTPGLPSAVSDAGGPVDRAVAPVEARPQTAITRAMSDEGSAALAELPLVASSQSPSSEPARAGAAADQGSSGAVPPFVSRDAETAATSAAAGGREPGQGTPTPPLPISRGPGGAAESAPSGATMVPAPPSPGSPEGSPGLPLPVRRSIVESHEAQLPGGQPGGPTSTAGPSAETRPVPPSIPRATDASAVGPAGPAPALPVPPPGEPRRTAEGDLPLTATPGFGQPSATASTETGTHPDTISRSADGSAAGGPGPVIPLPQAGEAGRDTGPDLPLTSRPELEQPTPGATPDTLPPAQLISRTPEDSRTDRPGPMPPLSPGDAARPAAPLDLPLASAPALGQPDTVSHPDSEALSQGISRLADHSAPDGPRPVMPILQGDTPGRATGSGLPLAPAQGAVSRAAEVEPNARPRPGDIPGGGASSAAGTPGTTPAQSTTGHVAGVQRTTAGPADAPTPKMPLRGSESPGAAAPVPGGSATATARSAAPPRGESGGFPRSDGSVPAPGVLASMPVAQRVVDRGQAHPQPEAAGGTGSIAATGPADRPGTTRPWADAPSLPLPTLEPFDQGDAEEAAPGRRPGSEAVPAPLLARSVENAPARPLLQTTVSTARAPADGPRPVPDRPWPRRLVSRLTGGGGTSPKARESSADAPEGAPAMAEPAESTFLLPGRAPGPTSFSGDSGPADSYAPRNSPISVSRVSRAVSVTAAAGSAAAAVGPGPRPLAFGPAGPRVTARPEAWTPPPTPSPMRADYSMVAPPTPLPLAPSPLVSRQVDVQPVHHEAVAQVRRAESDKESSTSNAPDGGEAGPNVDELAEKVWQKLRRRLTIERERKHGRV